MVQGKLEEAIPPYLIQFLLYFLPEWSFNSSHMQNNIDKTAERTTLM